jgi:hypothetical protein
MSGIDMTNYEAWLPEVLNQEHLGTPLTRVERAEARNVIDRGLYVHALGRRFARLDRDRGLGVRRHGHQEQQLIKQWGNSDRASRAAYGTSDGGSRC